MFFVLLKKIYSETSNFKIFNNNFQFKKLHLLAKEDTFLNIPKDYGTNCTPNKTLKHILLELKIKGKSLLFFVYEIEIVKLTQNNNIEHM